MDQDNKLTLIKELNLMENKKILFWLNVATIPLLVIFGFFFSTVAIIFKETSGKLQKDVSLLSLLFLLIGFLVLILVHEGIHGLFFKLFNPNGKVKFGFKNGMAYATSPHSYYSKGAFSWISLAPFTLITIGLTILYNLNFLSLISYLTLVSLHASSCVGDFYFIWLLLQSPKNCLIEDTEQGINFYQINGG